MRVPRSRFVPIAIALFLCAAAFPLRAFAQERVIMFDGTHVPPFSFAMLMDSTKYFSDRDIAGKCCILVFGYVSMGEYASLGEVHDRYHADGLEIVQVWPYNHHSRTRIPPDDNAVRALRNDGYPLPWTHLQASDVEIRSYRSTVQSEEEGIILISPDGAIVASGSQMKGAAKEAAIGRCFNGR